MNKETLKAKVPILLSTVLIVTLTYFTFRSWIKIGSLIYNQYTGEEIRIMPIVFGATLHIHFLTILFIVVLAIFSWLLSTRVKFSSSPRLKALNLLNGLFASIGAVSLYGMGGIKENVIPFFNERLENVIETSGFFESIVFEHTDGFYLMLLIIPLLTLAFISLFIMSRYVLFEKELKAAFKTYEWKGKMPQALARMENNDYWPDVEIGVNTKTGEKVIIPGRDRPLNTGIVGSIGTGKTAALGTPILNQDLNHMTTFINKFESIYKREDYASETIGGRYLNGISVIDPSNDLCQNIFTLAKGHGIPEEAITYIDPTDPNTKGINPMKGPVDKVSEVFAQVIAGLSDSDGGNFFFEQAQRIHLKQYIYLLKLHDTNAEATFDMLIDMYNNANYVRKLHLKLKTTIPKDLSAIKNKDIYNYWKIVQGVDEWFDTNLVPKVNKQGMPEINDKGEVVYVDNVESDVKGLRNILNDISNNILLRRVLFGKSEFDFDRHFEVGGILLVNTAKGELVELSNVLGKIILMNLQSAAFRRKPKVSPFHHILVDELPDFLYESFRSFPAQSRKYKVIISTLKQSVTQLADQFGEYYMQTVMGVLRNRMVYADVPPFDAKFFSEMFGEKEVYEEGQNEMVVSPLQEDPMSRTGSSFSKVKEQALSTGNIMFQDAFECAAKIVINNRSMPVVQVKADFVPKSEFVKSKYQVNKDKAQIWLNERDSYKSSVTSFGNIEYDEDGNERSRGITSVEESEKEHVDELLKIQHPSVANLDEDSLKKALSVKVDPKPRDGVLYVGTNVATEAGLENHTVIDQSMFKKIVTKVKETSPPEEAIHSNYTQKELSQEVEDFAQSMKIDDSFYDDYDEFK